MQGLDAEHVCVYVCVFVGSLASMCFVCARVSVCVHVRVGYLADTCFACVYVCVFVLDLWLACVSRVRVYVFL